MLILSRDIEISVAPELGENVPWVDVTYGNDGAQSFLPPNAFLRSLA